MGVLWGRCKDGPNAKTITKGFGSDNEVVFVRHTSMTQNCRTSTFVCYYPLQKDFLVVWTWLRISPGLILKLDQFLRGRVVPGLQEAAARVFDENLKNVESQKEINRSFQVQGLAKD
jgi:hypothetical protein